MRIAAPSAAGFYANYLLQRLRRLGVPDLPEQAPQDGEARVALGTIDDWLLRAQARIGNDLGLRLGETVTPTALDVLGYASMACSELGEAIELLARFEPYRLGFAQIHCIRDDKHVWIILECADDVCGTIAVQVEAALAGWVRFGRWIAATERTPQYVTFRHRQRAAGALYESAFGCTVEFGQHRNAIALRVEDLRIPLASPNRVVSSVMRAALDERVDQFRRGTQAMGELQRAVEHLIGSEGTPTLARLARHLKRDAAELRLTLLAGGVGLTELIESTREALARSYLQSSLPLSEIALRLGYSEQSAFTRACRRWFGSPPSKLRKQSVGNDHQRSGSSWRV